MKISIIIPTYNEESYIAELFDYINVHSQKKNIEEIIIVDSFSTDNTLKVAEKAHAKLYLSKPRDPKIQMEIGAFQAKAEVLYFIKPGYFPPPNFDERILHAVKAKYLAGIPGQTTTLNKTLLLFNKIRSRFNLQFNNSRMQTLFIVHGLFHHVGGFHKTKTIDVFTELLNRADSCLIS